MDLGQFFWWNIIISFVNVCNDFYRSLGKGRHVRLYPLLVVSGHDLEPIKIPETKGNAFEINLTNHVIVKFFCLCE